MPCGSGEAVVLVVDVAVPFRNGVRGIMIVGLGLGAVGAEAADGFPMIGGRRLCSLYVLFTLRKGWNGGGGRRC